MAYILITTVEKDAIKSDIIIFINNLTDPECNLFFILANSYNNLSKQSFTQKQAMIGVKPETGQIDLTFPCYCKLLKGFDMPQ